MSHVIHCLASYLPFLLFQSPEMSSIFSSYPTHGMLLSNLKASHADECSPILIILPMCLPFHFPSNFPLIFNAVDS